RKLGEQQDAGEAAPQGGDKTKNDPSSRGSQSPAARTRRGSSPVRDHARGGAPENVRALARAKENPEGEDPRGSRLQAAGRRGEEPPTVDPRQDPGATAKLSFNRVLALDEFSDKP